MHSFAAQENRSLLARRGPSERRRTGCEFERFLAQHAEDPRDGFKDDEQNLTSRSAQRRDGT